MSSSSNFMLKGEKKLDREVRSKPSLPIASTMYYIALSPLFPYTSSLTPIPAAEYNFNRLLRSQLPQSSHPPPFVRPCPDPSSSPRFLVIRLPSFIPLSFPFSSLTTHDSSTLSAHLFLKSITRNNNRSHNQPDFPSCCVGV